MKYKIIIKTIELVEMDAENAGAALEKLKSQMDPRILGGPVTFEIIEVPEETT